MTVDQVAGERPGLAEAPRAPEAAGEQAPVIQLDLHRRPWPESEGMSGGVAASGRDGARPIRVLVVGDEEDFADVRDLLARAEQARFQVDRVADAGTALARLAHRQHDVCLCDQRLPGGDGLSFARQAAEGGSATPVILMSGSAEPNLDLDAIAAGAADFFDKEQFDVESLERAIRMALARAARRSPAQDLFLAGHELFRDRLAQALARARRHGGAAGSAVVMLALARLDALERRFGRGTVDGLLRELAERLPVSLRASDTFLRIGPNRFGVVLEELQRADHAAGIAQKLIERVATLSPLEADLDASAGLVVIAREAADAAALEAMAEAALARAQASGGGRCCEHDRAAASAAGATTFDLARELGRAIEADALELDFQPQVPLRSAELALAAVVRWQHPSAGPVTGERLRRLAETSGLGERLDDWVIGAACRQARRWHEVGLAPAHVAVPLLSRRRLRWSDLARRLEARLAETGLAPPRLELEIDECLLLDDLEGSGGAALREASALGVRLAVAGFGTGPTSLAVLRDAPLATVKLDRALLRGAPDDRSRPDLAAGLVGLVRGLGLRLVAEGGEAQDQLQLARAHGCDAIQAPISCPPLPVGACTDWLRRTCPGGSRPKKSGRPIRQGRTMPR